MKIESKKKYKRGTRATQRTKETVSNMFSLLGSGSALCRLITQIVKSRCEGEVNAEILGYKRGGKDEKY